MSCGVDPGGAQRDDDLVGDRQVARAGGDDGDAGGESLGRFAPQQASAEFHDVRVDRDARGALRLRGAGQQHRARAVLQQFADDPGALFGRLARPVDRLGHALAEVAVMIDGGALDVGERQAAQTGDRVVGRDRSRPDVVDELPHRHLVHGIIVPCDRAVDVA